MNRESAQNPDRFDHQNAIMRYDYDEEQLYHVYVALQKHADIQLTLKIRAGMTVNILVNKDMIVEPDHN